MPKYQKIGLLYLLYSRTLHLFLLTQKKNESLVLINIHSFYLLQGNIAGTQSAYADGEVIQMKSNITMLTQPADRGACVGFRYRVNMLRYDR